MIARLLRDKGVCEFVDAARMLRQTHPAARCRLLGPSGAENRTAIQPETVRGWDDEGTIEYLGSTADVRPFIREADCVVLPSYREGTARTLLEAAAMARPLIATDVAGCRNVVEHGASGFLVRARDASDLAAAMRRFASMSPAERVAMGRSGRRKVEAEFDQTRVITAYREALAELG
jgi:glycosyltransferase involved in cell wall biosynthesis